ncbi:hypothetical protein AMECASPLE_011605 [Ameca splendens]|uniref:Uncharacterized protein n=1 Tax=Ameca splendens TaxID=208324 RepID=A0ABV0Y0V6_9TELE
MTILEENLLEGEKDCKITTRAAREWSGSKNMPVSERSSQSPGLNPTENLLQGLKNAVYSCSASNMTALKLLSKKNRRRFLSLNVQIHFQHPSRISLPFFSYVYNTKSQ